jgi:copper homeostasis protein CutC
MMADNKGTTSMPLFYAHLMTDGKLLEDPDGASFPDLQAAIDDAQESLRVLLGDRIKAGDVRPLVQAIEIHDATGAAMATVTMKEVIDRVVLPLAR